MLDKSQTQADWETAVAAREMHEARLAELRLQAEAARVEYDMRMETLSTEARALNETLPGLIAAEEVAYDAFRLATVSARQPPAVQP